MWSNGSRKHVGWPVRAPVALKRAVDQLLAIPAANALEAMQSAVLVALAIRYTHSWYNHDEVKRQAFQPADEDLILRDSRAGCPNTDSYSGPWLAPITPLDLESEASKFQFWLAEAENAQFGPDPEKWPKSRDLEQQNDNMITTIRNWLETATMKWRLPDRVADATWIARFTYLAHNVAVAYPYTRQHYRSVVFAPFCDHAEFPRYPAALDERRDKYGIHGVPWHRNANDAARKRLESARDKLAAAGHLRIFRKVSRTAGIALTDSGLAVARQAAGLPTVTESLLALDRLADAAAVESYDENPGDGQQWVREETLDGTSYEAADANKRDRQKLFRLEEELLPALLAGWCESNAATDRILYYRLAGIMAGPGRRPSRRVKIIDPAPAVEFDQRWRDEYETALRAEVEQLQIESLTTDSRRIGIRPLDDEKLSVCPGSKP